MTVTVQSYEFRAEVQQLLNILVHSLYTDREIFLRELISNASDALNRLQFEMLTNKEVLDPEAELAIHIKIDKDAKTITVSDSGIGMNQDEMIENLGTIAHSGATSFLKAIQERGNTPISDIIGQFGVGFYSVFMVAEKVNFVSRSFRRSDEAYNWSSDGSSAYTIEGAEKTSRGTEITIHVKEDAEEFLDEFRIKSIIRRHSNYVSFPIYVGDQVVNERTALWRRSPREVKEDEYIEFYKQITFDSKEPVLHLHLVADAPVQFYALLYVPSKLDRDLFTVEHNAGPRLYARKVLIQEHSKNLLPDWMRFIVGVVDSEDLPLNISRETVQSNRVLARLKTTLSSKIIGEMESLAEKDPRKYLEFWKEFGRMIKEGVFADSTNRERLSGLLRFPTSKNPDGWVSLREYKDRMAEGQTEIYYLFGQDAQSISRSPHLDVFRSRGIEVIFMVETIDSFMINALATFEDTKLHNGADAGLELPEGTKPPEEETPKEKLSGEPLDDLLDRFKVVLGDQVAEVRASKVLTESAARLVSPDQGFGADMERVYRMLDREFILPKRILEINPGHTLIRNLGALGDDPLAKEVIMQLFESCLLLEGIHPKPVDMVPRIQALMEAATRRSE